jgi:hypothetical protein
MLPLESIAKQPRQDAIQTNGAAVDHFVARFHAQLYLVPIPWGSNTYLGCMFTRTAVLSVRFCSNNDKPDRRRQFSAACCALSRHIACYTEEGPRTLRLNFVSGVGVHLN